MAAEIIFWISILLVLHTYLFYPAILAILTINKKEHSDCYAEGDDLPFVSVIISAFNEEDHIGQKIRSIYSGGFPGDKFEVLVGSDHSDDGTCGIVRSLQADHASLRLFEFNERRGKGNVVNDLAGEARGEILILTDANVYFSENTLFNLVRHFRDDRIGLVDTNMVNKGMREEGISYQEKAYISREVKIKNREGKVWGAMMGPFGGCYAIRKEDYSMVPANFLVDDFYINMTIFEKGKLAINDLQAIVYEEVPDDLTVEFRRKVRIGTGNFQNLRRFMRLIVVPPYGFAFLSHKVIRWFGPMLLAAALATNILLAYHSRFYLIVLFLHAGVYALPFIDVVLRKIGFHLRPLRLASHFFSMNAALFVGFFRSFKKVKSGIWERTHRK